MKKTGIAVVAAMLTCVWCTQLSAGENQDVPGAQGRDAGLSRLTGAKRLVSSGWKASWSPDGTQVVYGRASGKGLGILDLESGQTADLTSSGKDPAWSPDGRFIAYVNESTLNVYQSEEVWLVEPTGRSPRKVADGGFPGWSADGKTLFVRSRKNNKILAVDVDDPNAGGRTHFDCPQSFYPAISPDGRRIAFGRRGALVVVDRRAGETIITWPTPRSRGLLPAWSPNGNRIAFGGFNNDSLGLWVLDVRTKQAVQVAKGPYTMPAWSKDGTKLAFDFRSGDTREVWMVETKALATLEASRAVVNYRVPSQPVSPATQKQNEDRSREAADAAKPLRYYKAGDVGAFCADVDIPANIDVNSTVFTVRADSEKVYLLYVQAPRSVAERLSEAMRVSRPYMPSPEQQRKLDEIRRQQTELGRSRTELSRRQREVSRKLTQARRNKTEAVEQLERESGQIQEEVAQLDEQLRALSEENRQIWNEMRRPPKPKPDPRSPRSLKVFGRFQGSGNVSLSFLGRDSAKLLAEPTLFESVELDLPSVDGGNAELLKEWAEARAKQYIVRVLDSPHTSYYQYCLLQSKEKYGLSDSSLRGLFQTRPGQRRRAPDLYAMTTGALAIQESLQLEEMTARREIPSRSDVPISTLEGPAIKSHPFEEMLQGRTPKVFPVAGLIPYDNYYCHFTSISKEIAASDLFKQWGASLLRSITVTARDSDLPSRYMNQLCIDISELTRLFGDFVIGEIAITGGDPFLKEGSDVALIIEVKSRRVFNTMMGAYAKRMLKANRNAKVSESKYEGIAIRSMVTADRRISSHSAYLGDYKVYSNSMDTLKLIIDTYAKKRKCMAENLDFQYMRTIFPGTAAAEDGFIYMSDSFIRKLLSARWKIEAQRRIICQTHLRMIANAATMYRTEMRKKPSTKTLIEEKYLSEKTIQCPDGGSYSLDESGRAFCAVHNCLQYCTPISGIALDQAAEVEADDYKQFVTRYNDFWSRYFDPIGIRLRLGNHIEVETCILPLIENSIYNQLREIIGGDPVALKSQVLTDRTIVSITSKLGLETEQVKWIAEMQRKIQKQVSPTLPEIRECIGDSLSINFYDSDVLFTFAEEGMGMFGGWTGLEEQIIIGLIASSINLPLYAVLELKDEELARTFIREMLKVVQRQSAAGGLLGFFQLGIEPYSAGQYKAHRINTVLLRFFVVKFRLHYAIVSDRLIVSTKRYVLEKVLDALDKAQPDRDAAGLANLQLKIRPSAFDRLRPIMRIGWQERMREACLKNLEPVRVLVECHDATEQTLNATSRWVEGVTLRCPSGGAYKYDSDRGIVYCSVHGNRDHPRQPAQPTDTEGLLTFLDRIIDLCVRFRFTEEGIMTKVAIDLKQEKQ